MAPKIDRRHFFKSVLGLAGGVAAAFTKGGKIHIWEDEPKKDTFTYYHTEPDTFTFGIDDSYIYYNETLIYKTE